MPAYTHANGSPLGSDLYWAEDRNADFATKYGTIQFLPLRSRSNADYEAGVAISAGVPTNDDEFDSVVISTLIFNPDGSNGTTLYVKNATGGTGIAAITDGEDA